MKLRRKKSCAPAKAELSYDREAKGWWLAIEGCDMALRGTTVYLPKKASDADLRKAAEVEAKESFGLALAADRVEVKR